MMNPVNLVILSKPIPVAAQSEGTLCGGGGKFLQRLLNHLLQSLLIL